MTDAAPVRRKIHTRRIVIEGYERADGLWDIEAELTDVRSDAIDLITSVRAAGTPLHHMLLRITVDADLLIMAAHAATAASPYPGTCERITPDYRQLVGLRIAGGFRRELGRLFGNLRGCAHMTELIGAMATAALQTVGPHRERHDPGRPAKIGGCHALASDGAMVALYYPKWHTPA